MTKVEGQTLLADAEAAHKSASEIDFIWPQIVQPFKLKWPTQDRPHTQVAYSAPLGQVPL